MRTNSLHPLPRVYYYYYITMHDVSQSIIMRTCQQTPELGPVMDHHRLVAVASQDGFKLVYAKNSLARLLLADPNQ